MNENKEGREIKSSSKEPMGKNAVSSISTESKHLHSGIEHLQRVLADTFVLFMKTLAVHWNYRGSKFFSVHKLTEKQYAELTVAVDELAERIRAVGEGTPIYLADFLDQADLSEFKGHSAGTDGALKNLALSHELLAKRAKQAALAMEDDLYSHDLMVKRIGEHQKAAWMLRSFLSSDASDTEEKTRH